MLRCSSIVHDASKLYTAYKLTLYTFIVVLVLKGIMDAFISKLFTNQQTSRQIEETTQTMNNLCTQTEASLPTMKIRRLTKLR